MFQIILFSPLRNTPSYIQYLWKHYQKKKKLISCSREKYSLHLCTEKDNSSSIYEYTLHFRPSVFLWCESTAFCLKDAKIRLNIINISAGFCWNTSKFKMGITVYCCVLVDEVSILISHLAWIGLHFRRVGTWRLSVVQWSVACICL